VKLHYKEIDNKIKRLVANAPFLFLGLCALRAGFSGGLSVSLQSSCAVAGKPKIK
jgi:hypothetical protein